MMIFSRNIASWKWNPVVLVLPLAVIVGSVLGLGNGKLSTLLILGFAVVALFFLSLEKYQLPFLVLIGLIPFQYVNSIKLEGLPNPALLILGGMSIVALLLHNIKKKEIFVIHNNIPFWSALMLIATASISAFVFNGLTGVFAYARGYWLVILLYFLSTNFIISDGDAKKLAWILVVSLALMGASIVVLQMAFIFEGGGIPTAAALHRNANGNLFLGTSSQNLSIWLSKGIPFAVSLWLLEKETKKIRFFLAICIALMFLGILTTVSLTGIWGLLLTLILILVIYQGRYRRWLLALCVTIIVGSVTFSPLTERINNTLVTIQEDDPLAWGSNRVRAWYTALQVISQSPWLGIGPSRENVWDATRSLLPQEFLKLRERAGKGLGLEAHNAFLGVTMEIGIFGSLAFLLINMWVMKYLWPLAGRKFDSINWDKAELANWSIPVFIALSVYLLQGLVNNVHIEKLYWLFLGWAVAIINKINARGLNRPASQSISELNP